MAKMFHRRPSQYERGHAGCMWGLISIFDFRHGRSTRKLLGDRRRMNKLAVGSSRLHTCPSKKYQYSEEDEASKMTDAEVVKTSVKELMREEIVNEYGLEDQENEFEINFPQIDSEHRHCIKRIHKHRNRKYNSSDIVVSELDAAKCLTPENLSNVSKQKPSDTFNLEIIMDELSRFCQKRTNSIKHDPHNDLNMPSGLEFSILEATKVFIEHRLSESKHFGEEGKTHSSKELTEALQTLSANKALFLKLLEEPNSILVKHIRNLEDAQSEKVQTPSSLSGSNSEEKKSSSKSDDLNNSRHRKFFHRRGRTLESYPLGGNKKCQPSSKIVILKPGPAVFSNFHTDVSQLHYTLDNEVPRNDRSTSHFSFSEIRRKLRHAVGKERRGISPAGLTPNYPSKDKNPNDNNEGSSGENTCWHSPDRSHFYTEKFWKSSTGYKRSEHVRKSKDNCMVIVNETSQNSRKGASSIYIEAKKHLSEMLKNEDNKAEPMNWQLRKSLGGILSLPEYNSSSCSSPRKCNDETIIASQTRLSPRGIVNDRKCLVQEDPDNHLSPSRQNMGSQCTVNPCEKVPSSLKTNVNTPFRDSEDFLNSEVRISSSKFLEMAETTELKPHEEERSTRIYHDSTINSVAIDNQNDFIDEVYDGARSLQCLKSDSTGSDGFFSSPTSCPVNQDVENSENKLEKMEGPSPISVLEPLFTGNDISPMRTTSQQVEKEIQQQQVHFEDHSSASDHGICARIFEDAESAYDYVEAILLGSDLNWDDFVLRWLSSCEILDPSLFEEVEILPDQSRPDQKLLFDCTNEVLEEMCESYFGPLTGISYNNLNIRPVPKRVDLIQVVWKKVEQHCFQHFPFRSADQLIKKDMAKSGKWMNIRVDIEHIGMEMEKSIFDELINNSISSFMYYGGEFEMLPAESKEILEIDV